MDRSWEARVLLACVAFALLVLTGLAINVARLGTAIAREVQRVQIDYLHHAGGGEQRRQQALALAECVRSEMLKSVRIGLVRPDHWAASAREVALSTCGRTLAPLPSAPPLETGPRARPFITRIAGIMIAAAPAVLTLHDVRD